MLYIFFSICCSVIVSIMLKLAKRYHIDVYQAITWNYSTAVLLTWIFLRPGFNGIRDAPVFTYLLLAALLPSLFVILAVSVKLSGIVLTDIAERLSLVISILAAFLLFGEEISGLKFAGILLGFAAIICTIPWQKKNGGKQAHPKAWLYLLTVFAGMGLVDVLFKQIAAFKTISYGTSLFIVFVLAFIFSLAGLFYQVIAKKMRFSWPHIFIGWILGIANFGNILFYLKAHKALAKQPSVVFSAMNIGVIVFGALAGLIIFREKLTLLNKAGLLIAVAAIIIIANS